MPSTWEYTPGAADPVSLLRLQLADTDFSSVGDEVPQGQRSALFSDQEYQALLTIAGGDTTLALIQALYTVANNRALMSVAVNLGGGGNVDFTRTAAEVRAQAQALYDLWCAIPAESWAEVDSSPFAAGWIVRNAILRSVAY